MNLEKLFNMQAQLDADILAHHPVQEGEDRLSKKVLALLVELGECCQEWRGFKFWSNNQKANIHVKHLCLQCEGKGEIRWWESMDEQRSEKCEDCNGTGVVGESNPLLEEYVDCLHFILSIGNDTGYSKEYEPFTDYLLIGGALEKFNDTFRSITRFDAKGVWRTTKEYDRMFDDFLSLGKSLGFTWEQIEQAYYDKNKVNFERQANGY